jgi:hypothetical protein
VGFAEAADLLVLEPQNRLDVFVGKIARCGYFPDTLPHGLLECAALCAGLDVSGSLCRMRGT